MGYIDSTEVLVKDFGFISVKNVEVGHIVYSYDDTSDKTIESLVSSVDKIHYNGELINISGRKVDAIVMPEHEFIIKMRNDTYKSYNANDLYESINKNNSLSHSSIPLIIKNYESNCFDEFVKIDGIYDEPDSLIIPINLYAKLLGIYLSEGSIDKDKIYNKDKTDYYLKCYGVNIAQNAGEVWDEILQLAIDLDLKYSIYSDNRVNKNGNIKMNLRIQDKRLATHLSNYGTNCYDKFVPNIIKNSNKKIIEDFIHYFWLGDGTDNISSQKLKNGEYVSYFQRNIFTVSTQLANDLSECLVKLGYSLNLKTQISKKDYMFADHLIEVKNKSPLYRMNFGRVVGAYIDNRFMKATKSNYNGEVYKIITDLGNIAIKQNNKMYLSK